MQILLIYYHYYLFINELAKFMVAFYEPALRKITKYRRDRNIFKTQRHKYILFFASYFYGKIKM